jgi:hypothetical protein
MKLSDLAHEYVACKRALGMRFDTEAETLAAFCRRVGDVALVEVTADQVRSYLDGRLPTSSYWERKHTVLNGLFRFARQRDYIRISPVPCRHPQIPPPLIPYIYSQEELKRLLDATPAACGPQVPMEAFVFRTLILLLYAACLRLGESGATYDERRRSRPGRSLCSRDQILQDEDGPSWQRFEHGVAPLCPATQSGSCARSGVTILLFSR